MKRRHVFASILLALAVATMSVAYAAPGTQAADPVLVGAGDIARCSSNVDEATATLLDGIAGTVYTLGDNVYEDGTTQEFNQCYHPTWGRHKARTKPSVGNHEYQTSGATGYYGYFGAAAGEAGKGYYSYNLGAWHVIVLNSEIAASAGSEQERWLRADLAANRTTCTVAYWHKPVFSSGSGHGNDSTMLPAWRALYEFGADVVLAGHDHNYERFAPQNASAQAAPGRGIREFVVGTGGTSLRSIGTVRANSEVRNANTHGVLKLTLHATSYDWQFVPIAGRTFTDSGSAACVSATAPTATPGNPTATPTRTPTATPGNPTATPVNSTATPVNPTATATRTASPTATTPSGGTPRTVTLAVTDGYDAKLGKRLAQDGKVYTVTGSDNVWWETEAGYYTTFQFGASVPSGATIQSAKLVVEHYEEETFTSGRLQWGVGGGSLTSPTLAAGQTPPVLSGESREARVEWDVTAALNTAAKVNDAKFVVRNAATNGKKTKADHIVLVVTYR